MSHSSFRIGTDGVLVLCAWKSADREDQGHTRAHAHAQTQPASETPVFLITTGFPQVYTKYVDTTNVV